MMDLSVEKVPIDELNPYHRNPRRGEVAKIAESLRARGQYRPIVVNRGTKTDHTNEILAGNHTWQAAKSLKWDTIQVVFVDVDADQAAQIVLADNRLADIGSYDAAALAEVVESVGDPTLGTGYSDDDIAEILAATAPKQLADADAEQVPEAPKTPYTKVGQVWKLGDSVLVVGSSTDEELVRKGVTLLGDDPQCIWTDPPYGVNYVGGTKDKLKISNDFTIDKAIDVTEQAFALAVKICRSGSPFYMAHPDKYRVQFQQAIEQVGCDWRQTLIWVKSQLSLGYADYQIQEEPIAYGFFPNPAGGGRLGRGGIHWYGDAKQTTVLRFDKPRANREHPTMKPVDLIQSMLKNSCRKGGSVYDPFGGSGSTLIAATGLGMRCLTVELDPKYADVICRRYQEFTGILPELDGEPHDFTQEEPEV